ncbi:MAG: HipA domain-containing protein, partial [Eggerthellaceae bacterium]|nr:HipA domain-containing protein [Eggerthellaceae bacterium]
MPEKLLVFRNSQLLGNIEFLDAAPSNNFVFTYDDEFFSSVQNPLDGLSFNIGKASRQIRSASLLFYLGSLLPDGQRRVDLANTLRIGQDNVGELLYRLAGDCVGDLAFVTEKQASTHHDGRMRYSPLPENEFMSFLAARDTILFDVRERISLFGAQNKTALFKEPGAKVETASSWYKPSAFAPSNYIIKTPSRIKFLNINEYICTQLADVCGIEVPKTYLFGKEDPLLISERYDRFYSSGSIVRLHQEDIFQITQARGFYESSGGPSVNEVVDCLSRYGTHSYADVRQFILTFLFNFLIGNVDAHGRNFAMLVDHDGEVRISPSYDLTAANMYYTQGDMAMRFGREYQEANVTDEDLTIFCKQCGIDEKTVRQEFHRLVDDISNRAAGICAQAESAFKTSFCDEMYEHLQRQVSQKAT